jgi:hypothetical protein
MDVHKMAKAGMVVEDILKTCIVILIGSTIYYCTGFITSKEKTVEQPSQILLLDLAHIEKFKTNIVVNIPAGRWGSGIR